MKQQYNTEIKVAIIILVATFILMLLLSYKCCAQDDSIVHYYDHAGNNPKLRLVSFDYNSPYILADSIILRQKLAFDISCNYRQYEYHQDRAMMFGLISVMMFPCVAAFGICLRDKDKFGATFYGIYSVVSITSATLSIINLVKARKIKNRKFKNN